MGRCLFFIHLSSNEVLTEQVDAFGFDNGEHLILYLFIITFFSIDGKKSLLANNLVALSM